MIVLSSGDTNAGRQPKGGVGGQRQAGKREMGTDRTTSMTDEAPLVWVMLLPSGSRSSNRSGGGGDDWCRGRGHRRRGSGRLWRAVRVERAGRRRRQERVLPSSSSSSVVVSVRDEGSAELVETTMAGRAGQGRHRRAGARGLGAESLSPSQDRHALDSNADRCSHGPPFASRNTECCISPSRGGYEGGGKQIRRRRRAGQGRGRGGGAKGRRVARPSGRVEPAVGRCTAEASAASGCGTDARWGDLAVHGSPRGDVQQRRWMQEEGGLKTGQRRSRRAGMASRRARRTCRPLPASGLASRPRPED